MSATTLFILSTGAATGIGLASGNTPLAYMGFIGLVGYVVGRLAA